MSLSRRLARPMLSSIFFAGSVPALRNAPAIAPRAQKVTDVVVPPLREAGVPVPSDPVTLVRVNAATQVLAGAALATGRAPRLAALVLAGTLVPTTVAGHRFWEVEDAAERTQQRLHFFKNLSLLGGLLIAAGDTDGSPSLSWRAKRAARHAADRLPTPSS